MEDEEKDIEEGFGEAFGDLLEKLGKEIEEDKKKHGETYMLKRLLEEEGSVEIENVMERGGNYRPSGMGDTESGDLVAVRPSADENTYMGIFLGNFPVSNTLFYRKKSKSLQLSSRTNPAIFVPKLNKVVFGYESWWGKIDSEDDFEEITDETIQDQWYVKMMKELSEEDEENVEDDE